jgi:phosphatidylserine/phosphatidylglycerophosphate/cardiolipin synthase-like enzyme
MPSAGRINAELVVDNDYLSTLLNLLDGANERVDLITYSFTIPKRIPNSAPKEIAEKLVSTRARGVDVRVYIEMYRETAPRNRPTAQFFEDAGIEVRHGKTHAKGIRVDERVLFGSTNMTQQSLTKNIETNLLFDDERVTHGFNQYFTHLWNGGKHGGVVLDPPMIADGGFERVLIDVIDTAQSRIDFSIYFFHHSAIQNALIRAQKRGVHVRGLIHTHEAFAMSYVRRTHGTVQRLVDGGVTDLHFGPPHLFTHSKFLVRDESDIFMSTANWLHEDVKIHPQLSICFENPTLARALTSHLEKTIEAQGEQITP